MKKFGLIVGNGFTRDFADDLGVYSSEPLKCFDNPNISYADFIDYLPLVKKDLLDYNAQSKNDFSLITSYSEKHLGNDNAYCQLRRFLAISYSLFQLEIDQYNLIHWKWYKWLYKNRNHISFAISFNYDLVLERALNLARVEFYHVGVNEIMKRVPIIKPHGSLNFDVEPYINLGCDENIWRSTVDLNDTNGYVKKLTKDKWLRPRLQADIIPPNQENYMLKHELGWLKKGESVYKSIVRSPKSIDSLIIIGHSYSAADRFEIDTYLSLLPKRVTVYLIGNLKPEPLLIKLLDELKLKYKIIGREKADIPW